MLEAVFKLPIFKLDDRKGEPIYYYYFKDPAKLYNFVCTAFANNLIEKRYIVYQASSLDDKGEYWISVKFKKPENFNFVKYTDNIYIFGIVVGIERLIGKEYFYGPIRVEEKIDLNTNRINYRLEHEGIDKDIDPTHKLTRLENKMSLNMNFIHYRKVYQKIEKDIDPNTRILARHLGDLDKTRTVYDYGRTQIVQAEDGSFLPKIIFGAGLYPEVVKDKGYPVEKICFRFECEKVDMYLDL